MITVRTSTPSRISAMPALTAGPAKNTYADESPGMSPALESTMANRIASNADPRDLKRW